MTFRVSPLFVLVLVCTLAAQTEAPKEPAKCAVLGQVVQDPGGRPIRKANLELTPVEQESGTTYTATSDAEGHFKIENVKPGRYNLSVEHSGFSESARHHGTRSLKLDSGQELKNLVFQLQPAAVITGKITDNDGDPVRDLFVVAQRYTGSRYRSFGRSGQTNDLGEYRISDLQPGRYLIKATRWHSFERGAVERGDARPSIPYSTYYPGTPDKTQAVPVDVHFGEELTANFTLAYGAAFRIRGTVARVPELESAGFSIVLRPKDSAGWPVVGSETEVKKDGSFEVRDVLPGSYLVLLTSLNGPTPQVMWASQTIEVKDSDLENVRITPALTGEVRGRLQVENGQKIDWSQASIMLDSGDDDSRYGMQVAGEGENTTAQVKKDGTFDMKTVPPGHYHVMVFSSLAALRDCFVKSIKVGGKDVADSGFALTGGTWSIDVLLSSNGARIDGSVTDDKEQPIADAEVVLIPEATRQKRRDLYQQTTTDQHGHFSLPGLNPGQYIVMALADLEDDYRDPEFVKGHEGMGQTVRLDEGQHTSIVLKLVASGEDQP